MSGIADVNDPPEPDDLDEVAAAWFHRLGDAENGDAAATLKLLHGWIDASPEHADAFVRACAIWRALDEHATAPEIVTLREGALARARTAAQNRWRPTYHPRPSRWPHAVAACVAALLVLGVGAYFFAKPPPARVYATEIGERHTVTLADNSRVDIDAESAISVDFTPDERLVHVVRGQAYFVVDKDPSRPFVVESNGRRVVATGTAFNVEELDHGLRVTLVEGHVAVKLDPNADIAPNSVAELSPHDELTAVTGAPTRIVHGADVPAATAWRQGKLLFTNAPLADAIARMQRYSHVQLVVDPSAAKFRVSGVFDAGDTAALVDAVETYYPVETVSDRPNEVRLVRRR